MVKTRYYLYILIETHYMLLDFSENCETEHLRVRSLKESKGIFDSINLNHNTKYGHHLVATQDIQPGKIIFISKSYTAVASFKQFQSYCAHCVNVLWSSVPCQNCGFSLYCSEQCRNEAMNSYHDIECHCLQFILCDNLVDYQIHLALRSVIMAVKEFGSIDALIQVVQDVDNLPNGKPILPFVKVDVQITLFNCDSLHREVFFPMTSTLIS